MANETTTVREITLVLRVRETVRAGACAPVRYTRRELPAYTDESEGTDELATASRGAA